MAKVTAPSDNKIKSNSIFFCQWSHFLVGEHRCVTVGLHGWVCGSERVTDVQRPPTVLFTLAVPLHVVTQTGNLDRAFPKYEAPCQNHCCCWPPVRTIVAIGHSMASYVTLAQQLLSSTLPKSKTQAEIEDTMATTSHFLRMATSGFDGNMGSRVG